MAAVTAPGRRSLIGAVAAAFQGRPQARRGRSRLAAAAQRARDDMGTLAALASFATAGWLHGPTWGWVITGTCVLVAEFKMRG